MSYLDKLASMTLNDTDSDAKAEQRGKMTAKLYKSSMEDAISSLSARAEAMNMDANQSQLARYKAEIALLPAGRLAEGKLQTVRLVRKSLLLAVPAVKVWVSWMQSILDGMQVQFFMAGGNMMGSSHMYRQLLVQLYVEQAHVLGGLETFADTARAALEQSLVWDCPFSDSFCEMYPLQSAPTFDYLSQRWEDAKQLLGRHAELLLMIALCPNEYVWADCMCVPHDADSTQSGEGFKIRWNMQNIISRSANFLSYYGIDGFSMSPDSSGDEDNTQPGYLNFAPTDGLLKLFLCYTRTDAYDGELMTRESGKRRLWMCAERLVAGDKLLSTSQHGLSTALNPCGALGSIRSNKSNSYGSASCMNIIQMSKLALESAVASNMFSFVCSDPSHVRPLTEILHRGGLIPFMADPTDMISSSTFIDPVSGTTRPGLRLPGIELHISPPGTQAGPDDGMDVDEPPGREEGMDDDDDESGTQSEPGLRDMMGWHGDGGRRTSVIFSAILADGTQRMNVHLHTLCLAAWRKAMGGAVIGYALTPTEPESYYRSGMYCAKCLFPGCPVKDIQKQCNVEWDDAWQWRHEVDTLASTKM